MPNLILTVGPPGCGKTIWATLYVENHKAKRVNRDDLRAMMQNKTYNSRDEKVIRRIRDYIVESWLEQGFDVVLDDTNLDPGVFDEMKKIARRVGDVRVREHIVQIERGICWYNNTHRPNAVPEGDWNALWLKYTHFQPHDDYLSPPRGLQRELAAKRFEETDRPLGIIVDIDNTLALHPTGRSPYDHTKISEDIPNTALMGMLTALRETHGYKIFLVTGRSEAAREATEKWLSDHNFDYDNMYMRPLDEADTKDYIIKRAAYETHIKPNYYIVGVYEDREQTTADWRDLGLPVYQIDFGRY